MWRKTQTVRLVLLVLAVHLSVLPVTAQVLGPCGSPSENAPAPAEASSAADGTLVPTRVPLPGERATNFELQAVVGDEIKSVKLSDYNGQWRILCFYPADFTFV
jgi:peroxiredoxin (alkyl hydroperoxide reductase subunit C)